MPNWKTPKLKNLAKTLLTIEDEQAMLKFLRDLCTLEELEELSTRWKVVQLLNEGIPYREIAKKAKVSTTTVTRIAHFLHHGEGGYKQALEELSNPVDTSAPKALFCSCVTLLSRLC